MTTKSSPNTMPYIAKAHDLWYPTRLKAARTPAETAKLLLWTPFGLILFFLRFIVFIVLVVPGYGFIMRFCDSWMESWVVIWGFLMGIRKELKNREIFERTPRAKIIVVNHISDYDEFGFLGMKWCGLVSPYWKTWIDFCRKLGLHWDVIYTRATAAGSASANEQREEVKQAAIDHLKKSKHPLFLMPEGATTNGSGLLMFNKFVFGLGEEIQPVAVRLRFPFELPLHIDYLFDDFISNMFWIMFNPIMVYEYTFLPRQTIRPGETDADFANRVQQLIADALQIPATKFSYKDKNDLRKNWKPF